MKKMVYVYIFLVTIEFTICMLVISFSTPKFSNDYNLNYAVSEKQLLPDGYSYLGEKEKVASAYLYQDNMISLFSQLCLNRVEYNLDSSYVLNYEVGSTISPGKIIAKNENESKVMPFYGRLVSYENYNLIIDEFSNEIEIYQALEYYENIQDYSYSLYFCNSYYPLDVVNIEYLNFTQEYKITLSGIENVVNNQIQGMQLKIIASLTKDNVFNLPFEMIKEDENGYYIMEVKLSNAYGRIKHKKYVTVTQKTEYGYDVSGIYMGTLIAFD